MFFCIFYFAISYTERTDKLVKVPSVTLIRLLPASMSNQLSSSFKSPSALSINRPWQDDSDVKQQSRRFA